MRNIAQLPSHHVNRASQPVVAGEDGIIYLTDDRGEEKLQKECLLYSRITQISLFAFAPPIQLSLSCIACLPDFRLPQPLQHQLPSLLPIRQLTPPKAISQIHCLLLLPTSLPFDQPLPIRIPKFDEVRPIRHHHPLDLKIPLCPWHIRIIIRQVSKNIIHLTPMECTQALPRGSMVPEIRVYRGCSAAGVPI